MIEPISYGWVCPKCERVYAPNQEMCLYCGGDSKPTTSLGDWITTNPCIVDPAISTTGPSNIQTNGTKGSPYYTTTTGAINLDTEAPNTVLKDYKENKNAATVRANS